jgi:hypothetical protein
MEPTDAHFELDEEISQVLGDDADFVSKSEFKTLVKSFLEKRVETRRRKTFFFRSDYDLALKILKDGSNKKLSSIQHRSWVRRTFSLKDIGAPVQPLLQLVKTNTGIPVCPYDYIYSVLGKLHGSTHQHAGQRAMWDSVCNFEHVQR